MLEQIEMFVGWPEEDELANANLAEPPHDLLREYPELTTFERYLRSHGWEGAELPVAG